MIRLLVTSGRGPAECRLAVGHLLVRLAAEADAEGLTCDIATESGSADAHSPASAVIVISGLTARAFAARWIGSILWICPSPLRPHHKRKNWFVGVVALASATQIVARIDPSQVRFEAIRAGGPGGQHQNKTESAIRATHGPTGLAVVAREERSQHRNKAIALERLAALLATAADAAARTDAESRHTSHDAVQRGSPIRIFKGPTFQPV